MACSWVNQSYKLSGTVGPKSLKQRTVLLTSPAYFDGDPVVVASYASEWRPPSGLVSQLALRIPT